MFKIFLAPTVFSSIFFASAPADAEWDFKSCVPVEKINLKPDRPFIDTRELGFLLLLRSYISTVSEEDGLLEAFEFSPDGSILTARVNSNVRWHDGSPLNAKQAAEGITLTLPHRMLGERVKVLKAEIVDERTFKIVFKSNIQNLTGVLREALSTNSRHNRMWPIKANSALEAPEALFKFPFIRENDGSIGVRVIGFAVQLADLKACPGSQMSMFRETLSLPSNQLQILLSPLSAIAFVQTNTKSLRLIKRRQAVDLVRRAFVEADPDLLFKPVHRLFLMGEPGYSEEKTPAPVTSPSPSPTLKKLRIANGIPLFNEILQNFSKKHGVQIEWTNLPAKQIDTDIMLLAGTIENGRLIFLQDLLNWPHVAAYMSNAKRSLKSLKVVTKQSSSTRPPEAISLKNLESAFLAEASFVPIARKHPGAYSKKGLPFCLNWTSAGELTFSPQDKCANAP